jgi:HAE1 family hydrophobic/amphiphilic exporter-1
MGLFDFPVRSPVKVLMIFLGILLLGYISLQRLTISLFPDLRSPRITVVVETEGLSPEEIERSIVESLEHRLITIRGVNDLVTISRADTALATVTFDWGSDMDFALVDVKKAVSDLAQHDNVKDISTLQYDPNALPIYTFSLSGDANQEVLFRLADDVFKEKMRQLSGVAEAKITGGLEKEVSVRVDESQMLYYKLSLGAIQSALANTLKESSGGYVMRGDQSLLLKMAVDKGNLDAIGLTVVGYSGDLPVYLRDVAIIDVRTKDPESLVRSNGEPAVGISLYKDSKANTVRVVQSVEETLEGLKKGLPKGVKLETAYDQSVFLRQAIRQLVQTAGVGMILAMLVLLIFLRNIFSTLIISLAIPLSIVATFNLMYFQDITFNLMSLGGLALGSGMLVDSAIVVLESIFSQREAGMSRQAAAIEGTRQVGAAIIASTMTTCVVFLPIVYVHGVAGLLFKDFAKTVIFALIASLLVALLLVPMLCGRFLRSGSQRKAEERPLYRSLLTWALEHRFVVVACSAALIAVCPILLERIPLEFMPKTEEGQVVMRVRMPAGTRIEVTNQAVEQIEQRIQALGDRVQSIYSRIGSPKAEAALQGEEVEGSNTAEIVLALKSVDEGGPHATDIIDALRPDVEKIPDLKVQYILQQSSLGEILSTGGAPIVIEIEGDDLDALGFCANLVATDLKSLPQLHNIGTNILEGNPEVRLKLNRTLMANLGFTTESIVALLRSRLQGAVVTTFHSREGDLDVRLNTKQLEFEGLEHLGKMRLLSPKGHETTLGDLAEFTDARGNQEIVRRGQKRLARVYASIREGKLSDAAEAVTAAMEQIQLPAGYRMRLSGEEEQRIKSFQLLTFAFLLAFVLVYMVLASTLESLIQPLTIMFTVPLAFIGVVAAFLLTGETLNLLAMIGVVMLVGIVVNNAIVFLDYVNRLRADGIEVREALLLAGQRRLRPIFMTTLTTILALFPLALGLGQGARLQRPLAVAVIGGLASATILTLVVIPVVYSIFEDIGQFVRRLASRKKKSQEDQAA